MTAPVHAPAVTTLNDIVLRRLDAETKPEDTWSALVLAALESPEELGKLLDEGESAAVKGSERVQPEKPALGVMSQGELHSLALRWIASKPTISGPEVRPRVDRIGPVSGEGRGR